MALPVILLYPVGFMLVARLFDEVESHFATKEALRSSEAHNRALLEAIPDLMFIFSRDGRVMDLQAPEGRILAVPPERLLGRHIREAFPPGLAELTLEKIQELEEGGKALHYEYQLDLEGEARQFESRLVPAGEGEYLAIVRDITERKASERAVLESQALYEDLVSNAMTGIYRIREQRDPGGVTRLSFDFLNDRLCEITGVSGDLLRERPAILEEQVHPEDLDAWRANLREALESGRNFSWEGRLLRRDGPRWASFEGRPRQLDARTRLWTGVVVDLQHVKQAEAERQALERRMLHVQKLESLGVLAGGVAHDFNNLLMAILGHADLARTRLGPASPLATNLAAIEGAARKASDLCGQMLAYSGRGRFIIETIDLSGLAEEMTHLLEASIGKKALLQLDLARDLPPTEGDATQIRQILLNLITNASEAVGEKAGLITLRTGAVTAVPARARSGENA
jgi:PAS domain S-box-containing protein